MAKLTIASYEETVERLKNEQYRLVFPLRLRKSSKTSQGNTDEKTLSKKKTKKKE